MEERVIKTKHDNSCRIELLFSIVQAELQGKLKTDTNHKSLIQTDETLSNQITHPDREAIAIGISEKYKSFKGKEFKILYEALIEMDLFPKRNKRQTFFRCLQNEGYNINNHQMLEDQYFQTGYKIKGEYSKSDDEKQRDKIIKYLKTIIDTK